MQRLYKNCYEMDSRCYKKYSLNEDILMEHASLGVARVIKERFEIGSSVLIVAGAGNNGADGITLARLLQNSYRVSLFLPLGVKSNMAKVQLERSKRVGVEIVNIIKESDVVVDAIFGAGLNRELSSEIKEIVEKLNALKGFKIACDIPTGLNESGFPSPVAFRADITVTMGALKESLYLDEAKIYVGDIECVDLGVDRTLYEIESSTYLLEESDFMLPIRANRPTANKGSFGHSVIFCGEKAGAGIMSGLASSRFGAGLTTLIVRDRLEVPHILMTSSTIPTKATALALGMGLGDIFEAEFLKKEVIDSSLPILLDADAFSKVELLEILYQKDRKVVITPHPVEFTRLWKILLKEDLSVKDLQKERFTYARRFSSIFPNVVLLLKGANPIISYKEELFVNPLGSVVLAKGGSGDVLSGIIVALLAQGYEALEATIQGSLALAMSARVYKGADYSMVATDLIDNLKLLKRGIYT